MRWRHITILPFKTGFAVFPILRRRRMHAEKNYTSQLGAGLGMIPETMDLLRLWEPGLTPLQLADRAVELGLFSRTTARRARNLTLEMFAPRYLANQGAAASLIKVLLENRLPHEGVIQL